MPRNISALGLFCLAVALLAVAIGQQSATAGTDAVVVGILEHLSPAQQERLAEAYGRKTGAVVRLAFRSRGGTWEAFPNDIADLDQLATAMRDFPDRVSWTVAFDGHARGTFDSASPRQWLTYEDV